MSYGAIKKKPIVRIGRRQHSIIGLYSQNLLELLFKRGLSFYYYFINRDNCIKSGQVSVELILTRGLRVVGAALQKRFGG